MPSASGDLDCNIEPTQPSTGLPPVVQAAYRDPHASAAFSSPAVRSNEEHIGREYFFPDFNISIVYNLLLFSIVRTRADVNHEDDYINLNLTSGPNGGNLHPTGTYFI